jgi:hemerythrin
MDLASLVQCQFLDSILKNLPKLSGTDSFDVLDRMALRSKGFFRMPEESDSLSPHLNPNRGNVSPVGYAGHITFWHLGIDALERRVQMAITWTKDLNTGIDVIDKHHLRIVEFINQLEKAHKLQDRKLIGQVLDDCVDYTLSHFAFEESLQEEAGYKFCKPHKKVHELFIRRVSEYQERFKLGNDVAEELYALLARWLINHIKRDDADYVAAVKSIMVGIIAEKEEKKDDGWFKRFFK